MRLKNILSLTCAALVLGGVAHAADLPSRQAAPLSPLPAANWDGFYAGTFVSAGQARFQSSQTGSSTDKASGSNVGMLAGFNFQTGSWVYGVEGDLALNAMRTSTVGTGGLVAHETELLDSAHLRARAGYDLGAFLPYVAAGATYAQGSVRVGEKGAVKTHYGFNLGTGLDWRVQLPIVGWSVLRAEYVYDRLNQSTYAYDTGSSLRMRPDAHVIRAAFIYAPDDRNWRAPSFDADWAGGYAGFIAGYGHASVQTKTATASESLTADGALGGLYAGRNFVFGRTVLGFESATMLSGLEGSGKTPGTTNTFSYRNHFETTLRGRAGYAMGRFLPFVALGVSNGRSEQTDLPTLAKRARVSTTAWNLGAGLDYMLTERLSSRIEYAHTRSFKDADLDLNAAALRQSRSTDLVRAGLAWHFH